MQSSNSKRNRMSVMAAVCAASFAAGARADVIDDIGGLTLRLNGSNITQSGGFVTGWGSLSQGTATNQPTYVASDAQFNGMPTVDFDGSNDYLFGSGVNIQARTVIAVVDVDVFGSLDGLASRGDDTLNLRLNSSTKYRSPGNGQDGNDFPQAFTGAGTGGSVAINTGPSPNQAIGSYAVGTPHVVIAEAPSTQTYTNLMLGNGSTSLSRWWDGQMAEVLMFDRRLSIAEQNTVLSYVSTTYGVAVTAARPGYVIGGLLGSDTTDPENDGAADANVNYNVVQFFSNNEPGFGGAELAFNVFDNRTGGGSDKWCCDGVATPSEGFLFVGAQFAHAGKLTRFTATSSNDSPERDAIHWAIEGSNDGSTWTTIFEVDEATTLWTGRSQTLLFEAGIDYDNPGHYSWYRYVAFATGGANHALGELEFFIVPAPAALPAGLALLTLAAARRRRR